MDSLSLEPTRSDVGEDVGLMDDMQGRRTFCVSPQLRGYMVYLAMKVRRTSATNPLYPLPCIVQYRTYFEMRMRVKRMNIFDKSRSTWMDIE